jgi:hypothetical protein
METIQARRERTGAGMMNLTAAVQGLLPTPTSNDSKQGANCKSQAIRSSLPGMIQKAMLPTPRANDVNASTPGTKSFQHRLNRDYMAEVVLNLADAKPGKTSQLNPLFVLEMMGFPPNWTELPFLSGEMNQSKQQVTP